MDKITIEYLKCPLNRYTFKIKPIREFVEKNVLGLTWNAFAGKTPLRCNEYRTDIDTTMVADEYIDAYDFAIRTQMKFDTVLLDPPYSYRKSMEMYNGNKMSRFNALKDAIPAILTENGIVITFGYQSVSMGKTRGFDVEKILLLSHGGAIHDTICTIERKIPCQK